MITPSRQILLLLALSPTVNPWCAGKGCDDDESASPVELASGANSSSASTGGAGGAGTGGAGGAASSGAGGAASSGAGGAGGAPAASFSVTPSDDGKVTVSPSGPQSALGGATVKFTVKAKTGFVRADAVGGSCPAGSWAGDDYTTGSILADCTVSFSAGVPKIFVSTSAFDGNLGGVAGAADKCNADAQAKGGTYKALVVGAQALAKNVTYYRMDGTTVIGTTNEQAQFPFPLVNAVSATAMQAWTGIASNWAAFNSCAGWSSSSPGANANDGEASAKDEKMLNTAIDTCEKKFHLYCVEVVP